MHSVVLAPSDSVVDFDPIPRVDAPSVAVFEKEFLRQRRPVVVLGVADKWPASRLWSVEHLASEFGDTPVMAAPTSGGRVDVSEVAGLTMERKSLADCVANLRSDSPTSFYVSAPLEGLPERFLSDVERPPYCVSSTWYRPKFWLGPRGTVTPTHWDFPHNLSAQIFGRKRWLLYPPQQGWLLHPCAPWSRSPNFSRVDPERPDHRRFPRFSRARPLGATLSPGEMLYIPPLWWHHVRSLDDNSAVSAWFGGKLYATAGTVVHALKRLRGLYPGEWG